MLVILLKDGNLKCLKNVNTYRDEEEEDDEVGISSIFGFVVREKLDKTESLEMSSITALVGSRHPLFLFDAFALLIFCWI